MPLPLSAANPDLCEIALEQAAAARIDGVSDRIGAATDAVDVERAALEDGE